MPRISEFYGIMIYMYYDDHAPPHFHAIYAEYEAEIEAESGRILRGRLARRARVMVEQWAALHREELLEDWQLARDGEPLNRIAPLE